MYDSRDFSGMPILADALQDAGCDNEDILSHCRDANQAAQVRGCWVVDSAVGEVMNTSEARCGRTQVADQHAAPDCCRTVRELLERRARGNAVRKLRLFFAIAQLLSAREIDHFHHRTREAAARCRLSPIRHDGRDRQSTDRRAARRSRKPGVTRGRMRTTRCSPLAPTVRLA